MFKLQSYNINNLLLTNKILEVYINKFWEDVFSNLNNEGPKYLMVICKVDYISIGDEIGDYRSLGYLRKLNFEDKELFIEYLISRLGVLTESYTSQPITKITFSYIVKDGLAPNNRALLNPEMIDKTFTHRFNNMNLPITMDPQEYGEVLVDNYIQITNNAGENLTVHRYIVKNDNKLSPFLICAYNGQDYITSYANNTSDQKELFNNFINKLFNLYKGEDKLTIYVHNFSGFDGIFILKHLLPYGNVKPLIFNGKLMSIKVNLTYNGYKGKTLIFKDSYLLLPLSLRNLCKAFNITVPKG